MGIDRWRRRAQQPIIRMELTGAKELEAALQELPKAIGKAVLRRALIKAAEPIAEDARQRLQSLVHTVTGRLLRGIGVSTKLSRRQKKLAGAKPGEVRVYVGASPARHAHLVEFGTRERFTKDGKSSGVMPSFPFLRPAWEAGKRAALDRLGNLIWAEIKKAAERLAKRRAKAAARLDF